MVARQGRGFLALTTGQTINEGSLRVDLGGLLPVFVFDEDALILFVVAEFFSRDEIAGFELISFGVGFLHFVEIRLREEAAVREKRFVDGAQLIDAEVCVGNAARSSAPPALRAGRALECSRRTP